MTTRIVPLWLYTHFGNYYYEYPARKPNLQPVYLWMTAARHCCEFLSSILPYLKLKQKEAEIAIEFQKMKNSYPKYNQYRKKPEILMEAEKILHDKLQEARKCPAI